MLSLRATKTLKLSLKVWLIFAVIFDLFSIMAEIVALVNTRNRRAWILFLSFTMTVMTNLVVLFVLIYRRNIVRELVEDLTRVLGIVSGTGVTIARRVVKRYAFILGTYAVCVSGLGLYVIARDYGDHDTTRVLYCFHCETSRFGRWFLDHMHFFDYVVYPLADFTIPFVFTAVYTYVSRLLSELISTTNRDMTRVDVTDIRHRLRQISQLVGRTNRLFGNLVFVWFSTTLLASCHNVTAAILELTSKPFVTVTYNCAVYFLDILNLTFCVWQVSKVADNISSCRLTLSRLAERALTANEGEVDNVQLLYFQLDRHDLNLKAGPGLVVNKHLLLSFLCLGATYAIVYIQLNPEAMKIVRNALLSNVFVPAT